MTAPARPFSMDKLNEKQRSWLMSRVRRTNTRPEIVVRRILHRLGLRFRLHAKKLPGRPDIVLSRWRIVIFVHGCFWHRHNGCSKTTTPSSNKGFWLDKFATNVKRDKRCRRQLRDAGWRVIVVWECETYDVEKLVLTMKKVFSQDC